MGVTLGMFPCSVTSALFQAINNVVENAGVPVRVVSGFIECVTVSVPWAALLKESCVVELAGLTIRVAPHRVLKLEEYSESVHPTGKNDESAKSSFSLQCQ